MSIRQGKKLIASSTTNGFSLFDYKWSDHILNNISWLRADTFSWQSGDMYKAAYKHLVADFENAEVNHWYAWVEIGGGIWYTKTPTVAVGDTVYNDDFSVYGQVGWASSSGTNFAIGVNEFVRSASEDITVGDVETIAGIEITYYRAADGHKICLPDQEDKVLALYNATGVAWYYILDTTNKQFKLPRSKHNKYANTIPVVGNGMALGITTGSLDRAIGSAVVHDSATTNALMVSNTDPEGVKVGGTVSVPNQGNSLGTGIAYGVSTTPEKSGLIAQQAQDTDQYKYLYFYVGNFERDALEQTAGVTTEILNGKADVDLNNMNASQSAKTTIVGWGIPDYSAGVTISGNTDFVCPAYGVIAGEVSAASGGYCNIKINGIVVMQVGSENNQRCRGPFYAQIQKGDVVHLLAYGNAAIPQSNFYPFKGVN